MPNEPRAPAASGADSPQALIDAGHEFERLARLDDARDAYERALRALKPDDAARVAPSILRWIARTFQRAAAYDEALDCLEASLASAEAFGDPVATGHGINLLAIIRWQQGDLDEAKRLYLAARETARHAGEVKLAAMTAQNLGVIASVRGELDQALLYCESSLSEYRALGLDRDVCVALNNLGLLHSRREAWDEADKAYREAVAIADELGDLEIATHIEVNLVNVVVARRAWRDARHACDRALELAVTRGVESAVADARHLSGMIARENGEMDVAEREFAAALEIAVRRQNLLLQAEIERERAVLFRTIGRNREALQSLNRAYRLFSQLQARSDLTDVRRKTSTLEADFVDVARRWGESTESKDRYTQGHCERVADLACLVAAARGFDEKQMFWFRIGALLHDVGKLIIPSDVLNKPGRLTKEEWDVVKRHPEAGVELLSAVEFPWDVLPIVRSHHECWDGSGYPDELAGEEIPLTARIVCLADVYDALTTERSYKKGLSHDDAMEIMRRDVGRQFDPSIFPAFERVMVESGRSASAADATQVGAGTERVESTAAPKPSAPSTDELTGLLTRRPFMERVRATVAAMTESGDHATIVVIDIDHFKQVNDTFGHLQGDAALRAVAQILQECSRDGDVVARYAGDEFVILLPNTTADAALQIAERLRAQVENLRIALALSEEGHVAVSLSIGVATAPNHGITFEALFGAADRALYQAKRLGRNRVATAGEDSSGGKPRLDTDRFIGRDQEMRRLVGLFEQCVRSSMQVVGISGEAGIGKTTLLRKLEPEVRLRTGTVVVGRSHEPDVRPPYGPWVEAISALHRLGAVPAREWRELPRIVPALRAEGYSPDARPADKYQLLDEIVEYFRLGTMRRPLVVVLDDMQWGDRASWDALEHAMAQLHDARLMLCLTIRTEDAERIAASQRRISRSERYHEIRLPRLRPSDVSTWVANVLHPSDIGDELSTLLYQYSEGNPLFVVQILRELVEEGVVWHGSKGWQWNGVVQLELPTAVEDLLARRLSRLSPAASKILTVASVVGRSFDLEVVEKAGELEEDALLDAIDEGVAAGVILHVKGRDGEHYAFAHGLLAEALRRGTNPRRLQRIQCRVAEVIESLRPHSLTEIAVLYDQGGDPRRAYQYALQAGARATDVYALDDAIAVYGIAVRRASTPDERLQARRSLVEVWRLAGRYVEAEALCGEMLSDDESALSATDRVVMERVRLQLRVRQGEPPAVTIEKARSLLERAEALGAHRERIELLTLLSEAHARVHEIGEAEQLARLALDDANALVDDVLIAATRVRFGTTLFESSPSFALEQFLLAGVVYRANGDRYGMVRCLVNAGIAYLRVGNGAEAEKSYREAIRIAEESKITDLGGLASLNLGVLSLRRGNHDEAAEQFRQAEKQFTRVHNEPRRLAAIYNQANLERDRGDSGVALGLYDAAAALADELGLRHVRAGAVAGAGLAALSLGRRDHARRLHETLLAALAELGDRYFQGGEIVHAFLVHYAFYAHEGTGPAAQRAMRAMHELASHDPYGHIWLVTECSQFMLAPQWEGGRAEVTKALVRARELDAYALVRRLTEIVGFGREDALLGQTTVAI
jgi:diguanylate cyclase (GGDEF)-like protein/putative nucleotidyltransferase with HDIG domain